MPRFTPEFEARILDTYQTNCSYKKTADKLHIDERAVKNAVQKLRQSAVPARNDSSGRNDASNVQSATAVSMATLADDTVLKNQGIDRRSERTRSNMIIYNQLISGKSSIQIIAENGFEPELVQNEVLRYHTLQQCDPRELHRLTLKVLSRLDSHEASGYILSFKQKGYLTNQEMMQVIEKISDKKALTELDKVFSFSDANPPAGWSKMRCPDCYKSYMIVRDADPLIQAYGHRFDSWPHGTCSRRENNLFG